MHGVNATWVTVDVRSSTRRRARDASVYLWTFQRNLLYPAWRDRFGADRDIAGKVITLDDDSYTVLGVLPADFQFGSTAADFQTRSQAHIWVPLALDPQRLKRGSHTLRVIARLAPDVTLAQAQSEVDAIASKLRIDANNFVA